MEEEKELYKAKVKITYSFIFVILTALTFALVIEMNENSGIPKDLKEWQYIGYINKEEILDVDYGALGKYPLIITVTNGNEVEKIYIDRDYSDLSKDYSNGFHMYKYKVKSKEYERYAIVLDNTDIVE